MKILSVKELTEKISNPHTWTRVVICIGVVFFLSVFFHECTSRYIYNENEYRGIYLTTVVLPIAAAIVAVFGVILSIRRTDALTEQTETLKKQHEEQIKQSKEQIERFEQQLLETRFKNGIEHLGDDNINIRLTGIYELHNVAKESKKYTQLVFDVFCSFVRQTTSINDLELINEKWEDEDIKTKLKKHPPAITVQTIFNLLYNKAGEEPVYKKDGKYLCGNFTYANLQHISLLGLDIHEADFSHCMMHAAQMYSVQDTEQPSNNITTSFTKCKFNHTYLQAANMSQAMYTECEFFHTKMIWTNLYGSKINHCRFYEADLTAGILSEATIAKTSFENCIFDGAELHYPTFQPPQSSMKKCQFHFTFIFEPENWFINKELDRENNTALGTRIGKEHYEHVSRIARLLKHSSCHTNTEFSFNTPSPNDYPSKREKIYNDLLMKILDNCYPNNTPEDKDIYDDFDNLKIACKKYQTPIQYQLSVIKDSIY